MIVLADLVCCSVAGCGDSPLDDKGVNTYLTPSQLSTLVCPSRYHRQHVLREPVTAPFLNAHLGIQVHERIAQALTLQQPADLTAFKLPARALLFEHQSADNLTQRAINALKGFNQRHQTQPPGLTECPVHFELNSPTGPVRIRARLDHLSLHQGTPRMIDWKTGKVNQAHDQLATAVIWARNALGNTNSTATAIGLTDGQQHQLRWTASLEEEMGERYGQAADAVIAVNQGERAPKANAGCAYCPYAANCTAVTPPARQVLNTRTGEIVSEKSLTQTVDTSRNAVMR
jgi:PD-(D/E)XK nuclease superfamily